MFIDSLNKRVKMLRKELDETTKDLSNAKNYLKKRKLHKHYQYLRSRLDACLYLLSKSVEAKIKKQEGKS